jgi:hypothetical protein
MFLQQSLQTSFAEQPQEWPAHDQAVVVISAGPDLGNVGNPATVLNTPYICRDSPAGPGIPGVS